MSDFDTLFGQALESVNLVFAESVVYTPPAGSVSTDPIAVRNAVVSAEGSEPDENDRDGRRRRRVRFVSIVIDGAHPDFSGVADPRENATVTIQGPAGDMTYSVMQTTFEKHGLAVLKLTRRSQVEKTRRHARER